MIYLSVKGNIILAIVVLFVECWLMLLSISPTGSLKLCAMLTMWKHSRSKKAKFHITICMADGNRCGIIL